MSLFGTHTAKQVGIYSLLGLVIGLISYATITLSRYVLLLPLLLCFLYIRGGWIPVLAAVVGYAASFTMLIGALPTLLLALILVLPAMLTITLTARQWPFFRQFKVSVTAFAGGVILLLAGAGALTGGNLVDVMIDAMDQLVRQLPAVTQSALLTSFYPELADNVTSKIPLLGDAILSRYWKDLFIELRDAMVVQMLPILLRSCLTTAFLCSYLTSRSLYLKGAIRKEAFVPLSHWHIGGQMTIGILLTTFAAYLMHAFGAVSGLQVFMVMITIMECVFAVQGAAASARLMSAAKASFSRKVVTVGLTAVLASTFLSAIGLCSALFGRQGLLIKMTNHTKQN